MLTFEDKILIKNLLESQLLLDVWWFSQAAD